MTILFLPDIFRVLDFAIKFPFVKNILQRNQKITSSKFANIVDDSWWRVGQLF